MSDTPQSLGGRARAEKLTPEARSEIASKAAKKRWRNGDPEAEDSVIMSIRLKSGRFEGSVELPLFASEEEREDFVETWLAMMQAGIRCGQAYREAREKDKTDAS